jgi:RNA polymerase sigma-70 factor (ECF subfamily)
MPGNKGLSERERFARLYEGQGSRLRSFFRFSVGNSEVADDLTQETFLDLWARGFTCDPNRGGLNAYLHGIARKKAADWWRRNGRPTPSSIDETTGTATGDVVIRDALNQLPHDLRVLLWLREVEGYSYDELKDIFQIPIGTVRSRLHAARQQMRHIWTKEAQ